MSLRPVISTRPGTVALIVAEPCEVAPIVPCVAANALPENASDQQARTAAHLRDLVIVHPPFIHPRVVAGGRLKIRLDSSRGHSLTKDH